MARITTKKATKPKDPQAQQAKPAVGALGEDLQTNKPVVPLEPQMVAPAAPDIPKTPVPEIKDKPKKWPFNKSGIANERREMEHVSRLVNMKYDNPGVKKIVKKVVFDCQSRQIVCEDYKIEY